jgi:lipopolysaccharide biosynthesis glycosyltransferase
MTSCDDGYSRLLLPQLASIHSSLREYSVNFYLFHSRISRDNLSLISEYAETLSDVISFREVRISNSAPYEEMARYGGRWCAEAYFSLCAHKYLPQDADRVLYIDTGDITIEGDIAEYYFADFEGAALHASAMRFAAAETGALRAFTKDDLLHPERLKDIAKNGVFNSGSYVINLEKLRGENVSLERFLSLSRSLCELSGKKTEVYVGDQGLLSAAFCGDIKLFAYPERTDYWYLPYNFGLWYFLDFDELSYEPRIIHYLGMKGKPWQIRISPETLEKHGFQPGRPAKDPMSFFNFSFYLKARPFYEKWWEHCAKTPVYDELSRGARIYSKAVEDYYLPLYKIFNAQNAVIDKQNELFQQQQAVLSHAKSLLQKANLI